RRGGEVVERASPSDTERLAAMQSVADGGLEHAVWRQEIDELVKGDSSGELAERELDDARDGFADVAHASPLWAFTTPTASEVPAALDEPAKSLPEEPLTFYDPESSWSEVDGPSTADARVLPPLEEPTQLLPEEPFSFYDPLSILSEAESSSAADPRVPASIEEPAHLLLDEPPISYDPASSLSGVDGASTADRMLSPALEEEAKLLPEGPLISYDPASSLSGVDGASAAQSVAIMNDQKMEHPTAADVLPSIPIRKILLPVKPADKATVRAMKEETQAEVDGVSTAENVPILNGPKVERIAVADVLPSILIKKILHPAKPPKNAAARDEMETPRIEADGASTADNATITKEVEDAAVAEVLLSFGSVPIKKILYPAKPADKKAAHAVWRQEIDELVKGDSSGELAERELDDARDGFADVAHASPLWAFTTPTASEVPAAFDEPAKSLPEEPLTFYDPESSWSEVDGPSTTDARVLPPLEEPTQLLPEEPLSFYDPWSILSEAESSSAADPRVPASIEEPAHLLLDEPLISYDAASSLSGVDGASAAESVAITNDQKMEHPTAADVLPSIPIRKILLPAKPADKATVRAMKEETQAEVDGVSTAENVPILNDPKVERIAVADVLPSILIKKILHPAKPPKNAAARDEMETPRIEADGASTADNATITKEVEDAAVTDVLLSFGSVPIKMILYPAKPADKKAAVRAKKERSQTEANVALTADHVTITKNVDHTAVGNVPLSLGSVPITKIFHPAKPAQKAAARDRMEKIGTEAAQGPVEREDGEFNASMSVPITKTLGPTKLPSEADVRAEKEKPQTEGPKGWVESAEGEVNAAAWRDFSQQWRARRKRSGYDTYAKRASGIL
ncbi:hypothetical protein B0A55_09149, partial [Friedmanniomyces simplex]